LWLAAYDGGGGDGIGGTEKNGGNWMKSDGTRERLRANTVHPELQRDDRTKEARYPE
jgi:hypothetical protein